jgi:hypothetical protein
VPCEATRHILSQAVPLVYESRDLSYALSMTLAATPRQELRREEVDALVQLAYELHNKLTRATELLQNIDNVSDP